MEEIAITIFGRGSEGQGLIADVAVTKRHQRLDEIRIIFTRLYSKIVFKKLCHAIYALDT